MFDFLISKFMVSIPWTKEKIPHARSSEIDDTSNIDECIFFDSIVRRVSST